MPMSGNVGDTLNVMPVLSGIYKSTGHAISLVVRDKMKMFNGLRELMLMQDCISGFRFESDVRLDSTFNTLSLVDNFTQHATRPWETVRLEEYFRKHYNIDFEVDDNFELAVPEVSLGESNKILVGDRMSHKDMDQRREFNVLKASGKLPVERCHYLNYNLPMPIVAGMIKQSRYPFITTFTGVSTIADLLKKETIVIWNDSLKNWDNKPIEYSFNKHFYRNRKSRLVYLGDFNLDNYEVTNEV